jgi:hypothetical protein
MPKVHFVKKARKSRPKQGIRRGWPYWWWWRRAARSRARGVKVFSATRPRPSQLCSGYASDVLAIREHLEDALGDMPTFADALDEAAVEVEAIRDELDERRGNMPEHLQDVGTGEVLAERVEDCEELASALGGAADEVRRILADFDEDDATTDGEIDEAVESADEQIKAAWEGVTWPV